MCVSFVRFLCSAWVSLVSGSIDISASFHQIIAQCSFVQLGKRVGMDNSCGSLVVLYSQFPELCLPTYKFFPSRILGVDFDGYIG